MVSLKFFIDIILLHYGPGVDSASNRNEYQEYFLEVKAAGAINIVIIVTCYTESYTKPDELSCILVASTASPRKY